MSIFRDIIRRWFRWSITFFKKVWALLLMINSMTLYPTVLTVYLSFLYILYLYSVKISIHNHPDAAMLQLLLRLRLLLVMMLVMLLLVVVVDKNKCGQDSFLCNKLILLIQQKLSSKHTCTAPRSPSEREREIKREKIERAYPLDSQHATLHFIVWNERKTQNGKWCNISYKWYVYTVHTMTIFIFRQDT